MPRGPGGPSAQKLADLQAPMPSCPTGARGGWDGEGKGRCPGPVKAPRLSGCNLTGNLSYYKMSNAFPLALAASMHLFVLAAGKSRAWRTGMDPAKKWTVWG